jgi:hypothetical protein
VTANDHIRREVATHGGIHRSVQVAWPDPDQRDWARFTCQNCDWSLEGQYASDGLPDDSDLWSVLLAFD